VRRGVVLAIVAACGATQQQGARPLEPTPVSPHGDPVRFEVPRVSAERPHVDLADFIPDLYDEVRWPLPATSHPDLEPQFPIARELAIDVSWEELCERGVHRRTAPAQAEQLQYLRGWCSVLERDVDAACRYLKPLLRSTRRGMSDAVRRDLANILVGHGDADAAEGYITRHFIRDTHVLDLVAASYAELGRLDDASAINRLAIDSDSVAAAATKCRRLAKQVVLTRDRAAHAIPLEELRSYVAYPQGADPTCLRVANAAACFDKPGSGCGMYFAQKGIDPGAAVVVQTYFAWPEEAGYHAWWTLGDRLRLVLDVPGAVELALTAYEASLRASTHCEGARARTINRAIDAIRAMPAHATHEPRLQQLERACPRPATSVTTP
jgi:hypothetical protein